MMLPAGWLEGLSNTAKKRLAGNAVIPAQAVAALRQLLADLGPANGLAAGPDSPLQPRTAPGATTTARGTAWAHVATQAVGSYL